MKNTYAVVFICICTILYNILTISCEIEVCTICKWLFMKLKFRDDYECPAEVIARVLRSFHW